MAPARRDKIRVVLAEDQAMVLGALAALLEMEDGMEKAVAYMMHEFSTVRTGKASPAKKAVSRSRALIDGESCE